MRLLYFTDTHIRGTAPRSRTDDFQDTLRRKLDEVIGIAEREQVDVILHGGDVFDRPNLSPAVVREFAEQFRRFRAPVYAIAGNHDIYGHNPATLERTMLGLLEAFGMLRLIREGERILLEKDGVTVQLSGQPFHYDLDRREKALDYAVKNEVGAKYCIHMVHGMLVDKNLPDGVPHTLVHEVWSEDVDILLTGHYHNGFDIQRKDGKYIINPGALVRINNNKAEIHRKPQVVLIELDEEIRIERIPLQCAKPGPEVLDRTYIEEAAYRDKQLDDFISALKRAMDFKAIAVKDIINNLVNEQLKDVEKEEKKREIEEIRERAMEYIEKAEVAEGEAAQ
ncbi:metallophosphoesterase family protein [Staphylospora marina]|uniref:metallophosphoesterase family protein n=1 Tax=Staphylospora marina TaxID=2490858 RepID=UPI001F154451|nr:metallophosphoesterase [Staphylospora marina]